MDLLEQYLEISMTASSCRFIIYICTKTQEDNDHVKPQMAQYSLRCLQVGGDCLILKWRVEVGGAPLTLTFIHTENDSHDFWPLLQCVLFI